MLAVVLLVCVFFVGCNPIYPIYPRYKVGDCVEIMSDAEDWEDRLPVKITHVGQRNYRVIHWSDTYGWMDGKGYGSGRPFWYINSKEKVKCPEKGENRLE